MKLNYETCLVGSKATLVPYRPEHVERYHEWMKDPDLLEATGSEPLSIEEEYEMQISWRDDPTKCTFIVHTSEHCNNNEQDAEEEEQFSISKNINAMVGDVNLFLSDFDDDDDDNFEEEEEDGNNNNNDDDDDQKKEERIRIQAEIDIMIAEKKFKRKGIGRSAVCSMILYGSQELDIYRFFCKINEDNIASIKLFESIGFVQCSYAACFKQVELELIKPFDELHELLQSHGGDYRKVNCPK